MGDSSEDDDAVPDLVTVDTGKVPITIITGFLGKFFLYSPNNLCRILCKKMHSLCNFM